MDAWLKPPAYTAKAPILLTSPAMVEKLKAMGVPFKKGVTDIGVWKYVMVPAPDHVLIELFQVNRDALPEDYRSYFD